jgi:HAD superfamily hydrolase (TIGR01509 family)
MSPAPVWIEPGHQQEPAQHCAWPAPWGTVDFTAIQGLVFDLDDVLYDATVWRRWVWQLATRLGGACEYRVFFRAWDNYYLTSVQRGHREFWEAFQAFLLSAGLSRGQVDEILAASYARRRELEADARSLPGVRPTLARLHAAGFALAVLTDSEHPSTVISQRIQQLGLGAYFTTIVSSLDLEQTKPEPVCYQAALSALGLPVQQVAYVGHEAHEIAGAQRAGLLTLAFNYEPETVADVYLNRFEDLLELIKIRAVPTPERLGSGSN